MAGKGKADQDKTVARMIGKGAKLSEPEKMVLVEQPAWRKRALPDEN